MQRYRLTIHDRITQRHPEISSSDVRHAWLNAFVIQERHGDGLPVGTLVALGDDPKGRTLEMIGAVLDDGSVLVYHAMRPPTQKVLRELEGWL